MAGGWWSPVWRGRSHEPRAPVRPPARRPGPARVGGRTALRRGPAGRSPGGHPAGRHADQRSGDGLPAARRHGGARELVRRTVDVRADGPLPRELHLPHVPLRLTKMELPLASAWACGLLLFRTAGLMLGAPVLSARFVPARMRIALAVLVAFA